MRTYCSFLADLRTSTAACGQPVTDEELVAANASASGVNCEDGGLLAQATTALQAEVSAGKLAYDPAAAAGCDDLYHALVYGLGQGIGPLDGTCASIVTPLVPDGGACLGTFECGGGNACLADDQALACTGICQPPAQDGEACSDFLPCVRGLICSNNDGTSQNITIGGGNANYPDGGFFCRAYVGGPPGSGDGDVCTYDAECGPTSTCVQGRCVLATPGATPGSPCNGPGSACAPGQLCVNGTCEVVEPDGGSCSPDPLVGMTCDGCESCQNVQTVEDGGLIGTCLPAHQVGWTCASDSDCAPYTWCADAGYADGGGACVSNGHAGDPCAVTPSSESDVDRCMPGLTCVRASASASEGTCQQVVAGQLGDACDRFDTGTACVAGATCALAEDGGEVCLAQAADGQACSTDFPCASPDVCTAGLCAPPPGDGASCVDGVCASGTECDADGLCHTLGAGGVGCDAGTQCNSGYCGVTSRTCVEDCFQPEPEACGSAGAGVVLPALFAVLGLTLSRKRRR